MVFFFAGMIKDTRCLYIPLATSYRTAWSYYFQDNTPEDLLLILVRIIKDSFAAFVLVVVVVECQAVPLQRSLPKRENFLGHVSVLELVESRNSVLFLPKVSS
jgi:hypothetical protein